MTGIQILLLGTVHDVAALQARILNDGDYATAHIHKKIIQDHEHRSAETDLKNLVHMCGCRQTKGALKLPKKQTRVLIIVARKRTHSSWWPVNDTTLETQASPMQHALALQDLADGYGLLVEIVELEIQQDEQG